MADQCRDKGHYDGKALKDETFKYPMETNIMQQYQPLVFISYDEYLENWGKFLNENIWHWFCHFNYGTFTLTQDEMFLRFLRFIKYLTVLEELQIGFYFTANLEPFPHAHALLVASNKHRSKSLLDLDIDKWEFIWMQDQESYQENYLKSHSSLGNVSVPSGPHIKSVLKNIRKELANTPDEDIDIDTLHRKYNYITLLDRHSGSYKNPPSYITKKKSGHIKENLEKKERFSIPDRTKRDRYGNVLNNADLYKTKSELDRYKTENDETHNIVLKLFFPFYDPSDSSTMYKEFIDHAPYEDTTQFWTRKVDGKKFPFPSVHFDCPYDLLIERIHSVKDAGSYLGKNIVQSGFYHQRSRKRYLKQFHWMASLQYPEKE